jgi:hypothetical protein
MDVAQLKISGWIEKMDALYFRGDSCQAHLPFESKISI